MKVFLFILKKSKFYTTKGNYEDVKIPGVLFDTVSIQTIQRNFSEIVSLLKGKDVYIKRVNTSKRQADFKRLNKMTGTRLTINSNFTNVWSFLPPVFSDNRAYKSIFNHPCEKPLELIKRLVEMLTPENGLILDPFAGSGTLALACLETNRRYVCIEQENEYFEVMKKRISQWHNDQLNKTGTHELPEDIERIKEDKTGQLNLF